MNTPNGFHSACVLYWAFSAHISSTRENPGWEFFTFALAVYAVSV
nr:MAG TPA: protein of unknown function DUF4305 [Caudoviricetes sp.]